MFSLSEKCHLCTMFTVMKRNTIHIFSFHAASVECFLFLQISTIIFKFIVRIEKKSIFLYKFSPFLVVFLIGYTGFRQEKLHSHLYLPCVFKVGGKLFVPQYNTRGKIL